MDFPEDIPAQAHPHPHGGWPGNELEEVLSASLGVPSAGGRIVEVLGRSFVWVPLPNGGGPHSGPLDLPSMEIDGQAYVPVFSSEEQFRQVVGAHMSYTIAPAVEFARGLPPQAGIAVNPGGVVGIPLPPAAVAELGRAGRTPLDGPASGGRVRLFQPDWQDDPVDFLTAASAEFESIGVVTTARRCLAAIETADPVMFVGVELSQWEGDLRAAPLDALGRALGSTPVRWPVNLVLMDVAQDPVVTWMRERVRPFYQRSR
ncbi:enhanced serine sensitivity protein SseB [Streptomyces chromofuscus]|uniref:Enhanced serine sensitivity protein SseB n=1 Tax=Streptomyces chromofuscus TaxID=42881 RepID=A0A7M2T5M1_STRCW|nr:enhanced serine sensitivity protein SseB [Streptomyces chromofuscus]QOV43185.1 enhanced serine sensitivity protein SseB [Streptomyces chromofuscus]GGT32755.1 enhanced serine sensitivity protein SseB [Streptomyces chromofuscus]